MPSPPSVASSRARSPRQRVRLLGFALGLSLVLVAVAVVVAVGLERSLSPDPDDRAGGDEPGSSELQDLPKLPPQVDDPREVLPEALRRRPIDYVALGDSYSAGPGLDPQRPDPVACQRSGYNWPAYLADWLDVATYRDVTCTGATTGALLGRQRRPDGTLVPPQIEALTDRTDLVTVSLGGNDNALFATLVGVCSDVADRDPDGDPCRTEFGGSGGADRALAELPVRLAVVIRRIRLAAPSAEVVVVGYPQIFPRTGTCAEISLAAGDVAWAAGLVDRVDRAMLQAAETEGVRFVDVAASGEGHDVCAPQPWVTGARSEPEASTPWHPYPLGMREVARLVTTQLTGEEVVPSGGPPQLGRGVAEANDTP